MTTIPKLRTAFESNPNKDFLRLEYDKALVQQWHARAGAPLKYLGLPAWKMLDIIEWQAFLGRFTTIEREEDQQHLMFLSANVRDVEHRLHALYGSFDEILLSGRDRYSKMPDWPYDLVNLDYYGGFLYADLARPKAIRKLLQNQATYERSFMLVITQDLRDGDVHKEKISYLDDLRKALKSSTIDAALQESIDTVVDWYKSADTPDAARQALYINHFFRDSGETEGFDVTCRPAIIYAGTGGTWMIHFVTDFRVHPNTAHRAASNQTLREVINLGLLEVVNGKFCPSRIAQPKL